MPCIFVDCFSGCGIRFNARLRIQLPSRGDRVDPARGRPAAPARHCAGEEERTEAEAERKVRATEGREGGCAFAETAVL